MYELIRKDQRRVWRHCGRLLQSEAMRGQGVHGMVWGTWAGLVHLNLFILRVCTDKAVTFWWLKITCLTITPLAGDPELYEERSLGFWVKQVSS